MKRLARSRWPSPLLLLALWELDSLAGVIPRRTLTSPHEVSRTLVNMALSSELPRTCWSPRAIAKTSTTKSTSTGGGVPSAEARE
jgi:ABC-type nitrate/sulfonate/bicarbonate transport system permease component